MPKGERLIRKEFAKEQMTLHESCPKDSDKMPRTVRKARKHRNSRLYEPAECGGKLDGRGKGEGGVAGGENTLPPNVAKDVLLEPEVQRSEGGKRCKKGSTRRERILYGVEGG